MPPNRKTSGLSVCVVGAGFFAANHIEAWRRIGRVRLAAVADKDSEKAQKPGAAAYTDAAEMLAAERPDIVDIATPPETHEALIALALEIGAKAVICQKPFCGGIAGAERAAALAEKSGIPLIVHENFRFQPWYRALKQAIDDGRIGTPMQLTFRLRPGDGQGPHAYLDRQPYFQAMPRFLIHETGVHWIDTFRFLMGDPVAVYADLRRLNPAIAGEDAGFFVFDYPDGRRALFDGNRHLDHAAENHRLTMGECIAEGTEGEIRIGGDGVLRLRARGSQTEINVTKPVSSDRFGGDCVHALQSHVVAGLLDGTQLENTASDYLKNLELTERIYQSAETGRRMTVT